MDQRVIPYHGITFHSIPHTAVIAGKEEEERGVGVGGGGPLVMKTSVFPTNHSAY